MSDSHLMKLLGEWMPQLFDAAGGTLRMTAVSFLIAAAFGLGVALSRLSRLSRLRRLALWYIEIIRGTPLLTQLFLIYFGLTSVGVTLPAFEAAVIGLGLNGAAYLAEVYRAGIQAVDAGQREAAYTIGMTHSKTMRWIVLPQALRVILPPMANFAIALLRDTSVASLISAPELMLRARDLSSEYFMPMELYMISGAMYFCMAFPLSRGVRFIELRLARGR